MKKIMPLAVLIGSTFGLSSSVYAAAAQNNGVPVWNGKNPAPITLCVNTTDVYPPSSFVHLNNYYSNPQYSGPLKFNPNDAASMAIVEPDSLGLKSAFGSSKLFTTGLLKLSNTGNDNLIMPMPLIPAPTGVLPGKYQLFIHAASMKGRALSGPTITYNVISQCNK
ncbi:MAG: hypothetical protein COW05_06205 [Gammaproteobacteria bacterium CG12_big_fil_rev_8_21_14_0_65_46_12]|nr:MAG: hypothetical protein COW05_06205 [Gammaproteobacteria bacterium CG12_big_fil_rev_8_21_14_0_65_46_12]